MKAIKYKRLPEIGDEIKTLPSVWAQGTQEIRFGKVTEIKPLYEHHRIWEKDYKDYFGHTPKDDEIMLISYAPNYCIPSDSIKIIS